MEILTFNIATCHGVANLRWKLVDKNSNSCKLKIPASMKARVLCARVDHRIGSLRFSCVNKLFLGNPDQGKVSRSLNFPEGLKVVDSKVLSGDYNSYVIHRDEDVESTSGSGESTTKVLIPGLPDESRGECSAPINSCFWEWKPKLNVHYEKAGCQNVKSPPVLFLPGFGVGSFHYENQLKDLGREYRVWAIDFLGQASNPQLVKGVTLLNATPFWGFLPNPTRSPALARLFPWSGTFPLPPSVRKLIELVWQKISDPKSIAEILKQVYADHSTNVDQVFSRILEITQHPAAAASFASIMFAPQGQLSFEECLMRCKMNNLPICLMYGKEDPWVKPIWGLKVKRQVPEAPYYEISPAGHCPHDEVPEVVNYLLRGWINNIESHGSSALPLLDDSHSIQNGISKDLEFTREGSKKLVKIRAFGEGFSIWTWISSSIKSQLGKLGR
uniref:AB hydrolase-1 domain-containing protein n=1 Tax=Manihot esculenta TaxID=3983 RepID=A0A2C9VM85_MANES